MNPVAPRMTPMLVAVKDVGMLVIQALEPVSGGRRFRLNGDSLQTVGRDDLGTALRERFDALSTATNTGPGYFTIEAEMDQIASVIAHFQL